MKSKKIKRYRLGVSRIFPTTHPRKGEQTYFVEKIMCAIDYKSNRYPIYFSTKSHTVRRNYKLWEKRMKKVKEGKAVIDIYYWEKPGGRFVEGNRKIVFATLDKDSGCGVQKIELIESEEKQMSIAIDDRIMCVRDHNDFHSTLAKNDGLLLEDFKAWFKGYDLSEPMAIIHFTKFRY